MLYMRICNTCKKEKDDICFVQNDNLRFYKLCDSCRQLGKIYNNYRKEKKSKQSKENYILNKDKIKFYNKQWRNNNKEKLREYEKNVLRKEKNKKWIKDKRQQDPSTFLFYAARRRSKLSGIEFTISKQNIRDIYPNDNVCPILGIELIVNSNKANDNSPSLDRINSKAGYTVENIMVISHKANRIKNNATIDDIEKIFNFMKGML